VGHEKGYVVQFNIYFSEGSAATEFRCGVRFYFILQFIYESKKWKNYWNWSTFVKVIV